MVKFQWRWVLRWVGLIAITFLLTNNYNPHCSSIAREGEMQPPRDRRQFDRRPNNCAQLRGDCCVCRVPGTLSEGPDESPVSQGRDSTVLQGPLPVWLDIRRTLWILESLVRFFLLCHSEHNFDKWPSKNIAVLQVRGDLHQRCPNYCRLDNRVDDWDEKVDSRPVGLLLCVLGHRRPTGLDWDA